MRPVIYLAILPLAIIAGTLHTIAISHHLYWKYFWFDMPVHLSASAMCGLIVYLTFRQYVSAKQAFWFGLVGAISLGIMWEFFEYANGVTKYEAGFVLDTAKDLLMDTFGGGIASYIAYKKNI